MSLIVLIGLLIMSVMPMWAVPVAKPAQQGDHALTAEAPASGAILCHNPLESSSLMFDMFFVIQAPCELSCISARCGGTIKDHPNITL